MNGFEAFASDFLYACVSIALFILGLTFLLIVYRIIKGPTLPDRIVGLDLLVVVAIGLIATVGVGSSYTLYIDISLALGLVGFLATVAFARFILNRGQAKDFIIMQEIKDSEKQEEQK
ncbi:Na(+)/H(+) antiporter subunit F [Pseudovibrio sp. W64]|uniref:cation:proton antiporter n=1 Tax=unclassified Pseudovibrio TaxID=2627060 RepID=UPI00070CFA39|nr:MULTISPECIES: cation:proton antiporter [unclassified Pseudovibrio]KZK81654.1 Na(+)/H(+) antiporter subunit F [Pseudovibrio sp. W64]KZK83472.1 Na(+)/H(+) antiporter subunit F [Pseudovibrio sp. Ad13]KZK86364.1 Na(+)/H(+) antiporter subunit F [Pseudovibrio sp. Ad46]KZK92159.1 Na(+)/H(+) antiporter subunit F [Pseudovibrio sp. Ad5]KZK94914.1 Na(+)/H(+) antiporter subunit F [Pseudovibrio sp. W74]